MAAGCVHCVRGCVVRYETRTACFSFIHLPIALQCMMGVIQLPTANILHGKINHQRNVSELKC